jgi:succinate-semialdehyde dehydrogenase/glutarate-semialdehyde dehydrogenase
MAYQSIYPYNGKLLKTFKELTDPQLEKVLKTATSCFESWRHTERAIISSSSVRMTRTVARLASVEIAPEVSALCDSFSI